MKGQDVQNAISQSNDMGKTPDMMLKKGEILDIFIGQVKRYISFLGIFGVNMA